MILLELVAAAPALDVEAATRAYLDLLQGPARAKSDAYFEGGYWLILWNTLVAVALYWLLLATGWSAGMRRLAERVTGRVWLQPAIYGVLFTLVTTLLFLPWQIYTGFVREDQYGLMSQTFAAWLGDQGKVLLIGLILNPIFFMVLFFGIRRAPRRWWLIGTGVTAAFVAIGALIAPVFIAPLFNTYTEMPAGPLRDRVVAMARASGVPAEHIYVSDASRQTKRISANVSGLGPTIRITLNDNLLARTGPDEVADVMGHEIGHYVLNHVWALIAAFTLGFALVFFVVSRLAPRLIARHPNWRVKGVADPAATPLLLAIGTVLATLLTPLSNSVIRWNESAADAYGLDAAREPDGFAKIALRLSEYRKLEPGPIEEALFFDHPSGETRIRMAMQWKKDNVPGATMTPPSLAVAR